MSANVVSFERGVFANFGPDVLEHNRQRLMNVSINQQIDAAANGAPVLEIRPWPPVEYAHLARRYRRRRRVS